MQFEVHDLCFLLAQFMQQYFAKLHIQNNMYSIFFFHVNFAYQILSQCFTKALHIILFCW